MHVLVTGAAGFVGTAVVAHLAASGHAVRAVDTSAVAAGPDVDTIQADVGDWDVARRAVEGVDAIIHLASGGARPGTTPPRQIHDSVGATVALLEAARLAACRRFVLMSSGAVVADHPRETWIDADTPPAYHGLYALTKHLGEVVAARYAADAGLEVPILRPWVVVDIERRVLRDGTPLDAEREPLAHNGAFGWVERRDLAEACRLAMSVPLTGAPVIHLVPSPLGRALFDPRPADELLGWRPRFDFAAEMPPDIGVPEAPQASPRGRAVAAP